MLDRVPVLSSRIVGMGMADARKIEGQSFEGTGYSYTLSLIQGKHKMPILYCLMEYQPVTRAPSASSRYFLLFRVSQPVFLTPFFSK